MDAKLKSQYLAPKHQVAQNEKGFLLFFSQSTTTHCKSKSLEAQREAESLKSGTRENYLLCFVSVNFFEKRGRCVSSCEKQYFSLYVTTGLSHSATSGHPP